MKANLQKLIGTAVLGLALFSNSLPAWAGSVDLSEVEVGTNYCQTGPWQGRATVATANNTSAVTLLR